jgi:hypothetical protein
MFCEALIPFPSIPTNSTNVTQERKTTLSMKSELFSAKEYVLDVKLIVFKRKKRKCQKN